MLPPSLDIMFPQFPNHFLLFPMVFPHVSLSVSTISSGISTVSPRCFPHFLFQILRLIITINQKKTLLSDQIESQIGKKLYGIIVSLFRTFLQYYVLALVSLFLI